MYTIPYSITKDEENYITIPAMKTFMKRNNIRSSDDHRKSLLESIEQYLNYSEENKEQVYEWIDNILREGIKDIYLKGVESSQELTNIFSDNLKITNFLNPFLSNIDNKHICGNEYDGTIKFVKYIITDTLLGKCITFYFCKKIRTYSIKNGEAVAHYPVVIDYYFNKDIIVGMAKPKADLYKYEEGGFEPQKAQTTTVEKEIFNAMQWLVDNLNIEIKEKNSVNHMFKNKIYKLLDKYTHTPKEISEMMLEKYELIANTKDMFLKEICNGNRIYEEDLIYDINNLVEKYLSITYPDKNIFTTNRDAFPLSLSAIDEEDSRVDQTASYEEPLQSKAVFFDNKKMLTKGQVCNAINLVYITDDSAHYYKKKFKVKILAKKDYCLIKFPEYRRREDIEDVIFSIING